MLPAGQTPTPKGDQSMGFDPSTAISGSKYCSEETASCSYDTQAVYEAYELLCGENK
jgi:hypothetical protein